MVALRWFFGSWPTARLLIGYLVYADVSLTLCLILKDDHLSAISGTVLFAVVTVLAVVAAPLTVCCVHMGYAVAVLTVVSIRSMLSSAASVWVIAAHSLTMLLMFSAPFILLTYVVDLRARASAALTDPLTGLSNRRGLYAAIDTVDFDDGAEICVVAVDIDDFKTANDTSGHDAGDAVLVELAEKLRKMCTDAVTVGRVGGDEYVCVFVGAAVTSRQRGAEVAFALRELPLSSGLSISAGYASRPLISGADRLESFQVALTEADGEMYRTKRCRRDPRPPQPEE
ncbi:MULTISPECIES: GGDEF domain-containing protein [Nocardiaceae]|uniref:GGDEF domain-containing protein n=1 Tax=Nocardiaceae TaxID=85025 RepID=UPI0014833490|nr:MULTISPECIES: GGDEF domain-containing protein [Rhodococcus]